MNRTETEKLVGILSKIPAVKWSPHNLLPEAYTVEENGFNFTIQRTIGRASAHIPKPDDYFHELEVYSSTDSHEPIEEIREHYSNQQGLLRNLYAQVSQEHKARVLAQREQAKIDFRRTFLE